MKRFNDGGKLTGQLADYRIIGCPGCSKPVDYYNLRVVCPHCGYNKEFKPDNNWFNMVFVTVEMSLFLQIRCCGKTLYAMNTEHLDFMERYIAADLRERVPNVNRSMASRLPQWIKDRKNRNEILKGIARLRKKLTDAHYRPTRVVKTA